MKSRPVLVIAIITVLSIVGLLLLTLVLTPEVNPAFDVAINFVNAAAKGEDTIALPLLSQELQAYVAATCPEGKVSACIQAYTPPAWGKMLSAVFRRAIPDGDNAWDVLLVSTYADGQGFSGVCIYNRVERLADATWQVTKWSGFVSCDESSAGLSDLRDNPDAPNQAP
jgi:hypothetical protein